MQVSTLMRGLAAGCTLAAMGAMAQPTSPDGANDAVLGRWITESGNLEVDIAPCGNALCGKVVKVLANKSMSAPGQEMDAVDKRPALGMTLLDGIRTAGEGEYEGRIYNRENGKHYSATLKPTEPQQLLVRPYVGISLFGKTQVWRRPADGGRP